MWAPREQHLLSGTASRFALDGYSWMQAVHWVHDSGLYVPPPRRPSFCKTTVRLAEVLSALTPCRPSIAHLMRALGCSRRTVQYHRDILQATGLLAWRSVGTRLPMMPGQKRVTCLASEYERLIPLSYDQALGIRTAGEGVERRMTGISEAGRTLIAKLGQRASRKVKVPRSKGSAKTPSTTAPSQGPQATDNTSAANSRCTPMEGGCSTVLADGSTPHPSETDVASGKPKSTVAKKSTKAGCCARKLNRVGRRFQLAAELVRRVPWLRRALVPRIAWVVQEVADAGWTAQEVIAWLSTLEEPKRGSYRPSGLLAHRLRGMTQMPGWRTPKERAAQVERWRESRSAERARRDRTSPEWTFTDWQDPATRAAARLVDEAFAQVRQAGGQGAQELELFAQDQDGLTDLHQLTREDVIELRTLGQSDPEMVLMAIRDCGEAYARQLYTHGLVDQVLRLRHTGRMLIHQTWRSA
ncbi:transcriptional regulator [Kitasatospora sp. NPDC085895]|uniref:transcriptional regulator n=1 Tax=Kitasatospora sp. NPDC085895 TaxID=3155057 RepID=UPI00344C69A0